MGRARKFFASEQRGLEEIVAALPLRRKWAEAVLSRLRRVAALPQDARILDVGAASGGFVAVCNQFGYRCEGVEPWGEARERAAVLSQRLGIPIPICAGTAEALPYDADTFDVVHASSVIEHVADVEKAFAEINRVLKPGGVFWFNSANALCPVQNEIGGFPLFAWYPDWMKQRIIAWAKDARPELIGYTKAPAVNWFTPWKARALLRRHGFATVYDRWDLRCEDEGGRGYRVILRLVRSTRLTKTLADVAVEGCSYAALKSPRPGLHAADRTTGA
ncbi:MAG: methyltransferase domain-containing protein [Candidatus Krumholzibacteria bacterium]|nr:methyltransferase domain-containing protein [Candidatus Krumholzibacteria bacterium]